MWAVDSGRPPPRGPKSKRPAPLNWGAVKPDDLVYFGSSESTVTTELLADAQPIDDLLVAFRIASL